VISVSDHRRGSTGCLNTRLTSRSSSFSLHRHDGLLGPPNMKLTALSSSWKSPGESSRCSSSSCLGELCLRGRARVVLEPLGLSRSSRRGRLGSSSLMTLLESAQHSQAVWFMSLCQGHLPSRSRSRSAWLRVERNWDLLATATVFSRPCLRSRFFDDSARSCFFPWRGGGHRVGVLGGCPIERDARRSRSWSCAGDGLARCLPCRRAC